MAKEKGEPKHETTEESYKVQIEELRRELFEVRQNYYEMAERYTDANQQRDEYGVNASKHLTEVGVVINEQTERQHDEALKQISYDTAIINGILSNVYRGRVVSINQQGSGNVCLYFCNHNMLLHNKNYQPTRLDITLESFALILEAMEFAAKKFGIDRKEVIKRLTGSDESIEFKSVISHL